MAPQLISTYILIVNGESRPKRPRRDFDEIGSNLPQQQQQQEQQQQASPQQQLPKNARQKTLFVPFDHNLNLNLNLICILFNC